MPAHQRHRINEKGKRRNLNKSFDNNRIKKKGYNNNG